MENRGKIHSGTFPKMCIIS